MLTRTETPGDDYSLSHRASVSKQVSPQPAPTVSTEALRIGLAHLVHEINNPLQQMLMAVGFMETYTSTDNGDGYQHKVFRQLKDGIDELVSMVGSLRSELESLWQTSCSFEPINLACLIDEVLRNEKPRFDASGIRVVKAMAVGLQHMHADRNLLARMFSLLFKNAAEAMPQGGLLTVRAYVRSGSIELEVADTGVGIPPDLDVFQPFITSKAGGMGLGLAITRHMVEMHGGTIGYKSEPNKGTTFWLNFPLPKVTE